MQTVIPYGPPASSNIRMMQAPAPVPMKRMSPAMTQATSLPLGVPAFKPIPKLDNQDESIRQALQAVANNRRTQTMQYELPYTPVNKASSTQLSTNPTRSYNKVPSTLPNYTQFQALPQSISRISTGPIVQYDKNSIQSLVSPHAHVRNASLYPRNFIKISFHSNLWQRQRKLLRIACLHQTQRSSPFPQLT